MKKLKFLAIFLCLIMTLSLCACGDKPDPEPVIAPEVIALQGDYLLDAADYGMPIIIYINIDDKGNFKLSSDLQYSVDKGHGIVQHNDGTFMFLYSDSTVQDTKTATFTVANGNLVFSTRMPYGSSGINTTTDNPVTAKTMKNRELLGYYYGGHSTTGMMAVTYTYYIELKAGCEYTFRSEFAMSGTDYFYQEDGTFELDGTTLTLHPITLSDNMMGKPASKYEGDPIVGTLSNKSIAISVKPSPMAKARTDTTLEFATMAEYAGTYYGYYSKNMMGTQLTVIGTLKLDPFGKYTYSIQDMIGEDTYTEAGTYAVNGKTYTLTPTTVNGVDSPLSTVECTVENYSFTGKFPVSSQAPMRGTILFYDSTVIGNFSYDEGTDCTATLETKVEGNAYILILKNAQGEELLKSNGTMSITAGGMGMVYLTLTDTNGDIYQLMVSDSGINGNIQVGATTYGIALK